MGSVKPQALLQVGQSKIMPLMKPIVDQEMLEAATHALQNERLVMGESVYKFEEEFARFCGARFAISTGSGTSALQVALQSLGVGKDDEVFTTPFSFFATSNAVLHAGAQPKFADVEESGFNLDPEKTTAALTRAARAIIPVHLYGSPCNMTRFREISEEKDVFLIEDACQAHGAEYEGKRVGAMSDAGCFSFYTSKNMTVCGDGGMIVTDHGDVAEAARSFRDCGRSSKYGMARVGYTSRLNTVNAAIGRVQLRRLSEWNEARRRLASLYREELEGVKGVVLPPEDVPRNTSVYHLFVIRSGFRQRLIERLESEGIETAVHYPIPIHLQPPYKALYRYTEGSFPVSERLADEVLSLPMHPGLAEQDVSRVCSVIRETAETQTRL